MRLRLLLKAPPQLAGSDIEKIVETGSIIIGRSPDADWVIPDPERTISKAHCRIDRTERGFALTDTSTNGLMINHKPVDRGIAGLLQDGDVISLGDARIAVEIGPADDMAFAEGVAPEEEAGFTVGALLDGSFMAGPFGAGPEPEPASAKTAAEKSPDVAPQAGRTQVMQDWWNPNTATDKPVVPVVQDILPQAVDAQIPHVDDPSRPVSPRDGDNESFSKAAEGVDTKILVRAVEMAVLGLSEGERQRFQKRLRDALREEMAR